LSLNAVLAAAEVEVQLSQDEEVSNFEVVEPEATPAAPKSASKAAKKEPATPAAHKDVVKVSMNEEATTEMAVLVGLIVASNVIYFALPLLYPLLGVSNAWNI